MRKNEVENESAPDLEIERFSDHDPDLFLISRTFLIDWYMICMGLELEKKIFSGRGCVHNFLMIASNYSKFTFIASSDIPVTSLT